MEMICNSVGLRMAKARCQSGNSQRYSTVTVNDQINALSVILVFGV